MNKKKLFSLCAIIYMLVMSSMLISGSATQTIKPSQLKEDFRSSDIILNAQELFVKVDFKPKDETIPTIEKFLEGNNNIDNGFIYQPLSYNGYEDHEPPWDDSYAWADPPEGADTYMNKETGVGRIYPAQLPNRETKAGAGVKDQYYLYEGPDVQGAIILKEPSWVTMGIYPAGICRVGIEITEYDPNTGDITNSWDAVIVAGDYTGYLDDVGVPCEFRHNYIYGVTCGGLVIRDNDAAGSIDELRIKKIRWVCIEEDYEIDLIEPEKGGIYLRGRKYFVHPSLSSAILLLCDGVKCVAETSGAVDHVTFSFDGKSVTDEEPSGNVWSGTIYGVTISFNRLDAYAYDSNNNQVARDSVLLFKISGS